MWFLFAPSGQEPPTLWERKMETDGIGGLESSLQERKFKYSAIAGETGS